MTHPAGRNNKWNYLRIDSQPNTDGNVVGGLTDGGRFARLEDVHLTIDRKSRFQPP